jgi:VanZ family protein
MIAIIIFIASHQSKLTVPDFGFKIEDKIIHSLVYLIFGLSLVYSILRINPSFSLLKLRYLVIIIGILYGASDEVHQYFIPGRVCDIYDLIADSIGIYSSILIYPYLSKKIFHA